MISRSAQCYNIYVLRTTNLRYRLHEHNDEEGPTAATSRYYNM